jgi:predicted DNA-binding antitoxin AbrB/MazE fold protein
MTVIDAIYRNGTFQPIGRVELPEESRVRLRIEPAEPATPEQAQAVQEIYRLMGLRFNSGHTDMAARHNGHQP